MSLFKSLFSKNDWDSVSQDLVDFLRQKLTEKEFNLLTELCKKYKVFPQISELSEKFVEDIERPIEIRLISLGTLLTNVGKSLSQNKLFEDSIKFSKYALKVNPTFWPAQSDLAFSLYFTEQKKEAKFQAQKAIVDMDKFFEKLKLNPPPEYLEITPDYEEYNKIRNNLIKIIKEGLDNQNEWDSVSQDLVDFLRQKLTEKEFNSLTELCKKYYYMVFPLLSEYSEEFEDKEKPFEIRLIGIVHLLEVFGQVLFDKKLFEDCIEFFEFALKLNPKYWLARFNLTLGLINIGQERKAKIEAEKAIVDMDKYPDISNNTTLGPLPVEVYNEIRAHLNAIIEER